MRPFLLLLSVLVFAPAASAAEVPCGPPAAATETQNATARVYSDPLQPGRLLACARDTRRTIGVERPFALRGRLVAMVSGGYLTLVDIRAGQVGAEFAAAGEVLDLQLGPAGAIAAISTYTPFTPGEVSVAPPRTVVVRSEGCGVSRLADATDIDRDSLRLTDGDVVWTQGGAERRAPACPSARIADRTCPVVPDGWYPRALVPSGMIVSEFRTASYALCDSGRRARLVALGRESLGISTQAGPFTGAGRWVAWAQTHCAKGYGCGDSTIRLADASGKRRAAFATVGEIDFAVSARGRLVVAESGVSVDGQRPTRQPRVVVVRPAGVTFLSAGEVADRTSLTIADGRARWTVDGAPREALLP